VNIVDVVIVVILLGAVLNGLRQGFIVEIAQIFGAIVALAVAKLEYSIVRNLLQTFLPPSRWLTAISYLIVFFVVWFLITGLARVGRRVVRLLFLGLLDRLGGAVVGLLVGAVTVELLLYLGKRVPNTELHHLISQSRFGPTFLHVVPYIDKLFPHFP
jgi:membrane protein required for colicin V production